MEKKICMIWGLLLKIVLSCKALTICSSLQNISFKIISKFWRPQLPSRNLNMHHLFIYDAKVLCSSTLCSKVKVLFSYTTFYSCQFWMINLFQRSRCSNNHNFISLSIFMVWLLCFPLQSGEDEYGIILPMFTLFCCYQEDQPLLFHSIASSAKDAFHYWIIIMASPSKCAFLMNFLNHNFGLYVSCANNTTREKYSRGERSSCFFLERESLVWSWFCWERETPSPSGAVS